MKQSICPKAGECRTHCDHQLVHNHIDGACDCACSVPFGVTGAKCIRYRHQLEVAILREIAKQRRCRGKSESDVVAWVVHNIVAKNMYSVLKAGRKTTK